MYSACRVFFVTATLLLYTRNGFASTPQPSCTEGGCFNGGSCYNGECDCVDYWGGLFCEG